MLALALVLVALADSSPWPQWRGPTGDGVAATDARPPLEWSEATNVARKIPLPGPGASTPIFLDKQLFLTAQADSEILLCAIDPDAGKVNWTRSLGAGAGKFRGDEGNPASASCSTDGERVFAFAGNGTLAAFTPTGEEVWKRDCQQDYGEFRIQFGAHWTPVYDAGRLYLQLFHRGAQLLVALDAASGKELWRADRPGDSPPGTESPDVYASAQVWRNGDSAALIAHGNDYCTAHSLADGKELWRVGELNPKANYNRTWRAVASPLVTPELIVVPSCKNGVVVGVDPTKASGLVLPGTPGERWRLPRGTPDVPSPLLAAGKVYLMGEAGKLTQLDPATGQVIETITVTNERHRANPVYAAGHLFCVGREGTMPVVTAATPMEVVATNKLPDTFTASPVAVGKRLYLRGWQFLWVVGAKD